MDLQLLESNTQLFLKLNKQPDGTISLELQNCAGNRIAQLLTLNPNGTITMMADVPVALEGYPLLDFFQYDAQGYIRVDYELEDSASDDSGN